MTRLFLFATPALFVVCGYLAHLAQDEDKDALAVKLVVGAVACVVVWYLAARRFELRAWQAGRGNRPL